MVTAARSERHIRGASPDPATLRGDFPLIVQRERAGPFHYLDNAATTQKPGPVVEAIADSYRRHCAPIHRGLYELAEVATGVYERARRRVADFVGAATAQELVFTRSTTEAINMVAAGWLAPRLRSGEEVWVSRTEHHANFLPWQRICHRAGARLRIIEIGADGTLDLNGADGLFGAQTRLIALTYVSNVLGTVNPIRDIVRHAAAGGIPVLVDAAQAVAHLPVDVQELGCDFLAFSAHKMYGPEGVGALYGRAERLAEMEPLLVGGGMVDQVQVGTSIWAPAPAKLEAGSPNLTGAVGFAAAVDYLQALEMEAVQAHEQELTRRLLDALQRIPGLSIYGPLDAEGRAGIVAFNLEGVHPHDLAQLVAETGVAIRAGHHCCQPLMRHLGLAATARASFALYNRAEDVDALVEGIDRARHAFYR